MYINIKIPIKEGFNNSRSSPLNPDALRVYNYMVIKQKLAFKEMTMESSFSHIIISNVELIQQLSQNESFFP